MADDFNYKRAWAELAGPGFEKLQQPFKDLYQVIATKYTDLRQENDLSVKVVPEAIELVGSLPDLYLAIASRTVYFWGHWGHCSRATVHYPKLEPKVVESDMFLSSAIKDYIKMMDAYGAPEGEIRIEYHRCGPSSRHAGAHWKMAHMLDKMLKDRLGNQSREISNGCFRNRYSQDGKDECWATAENLARLNAGESTRSIASTGPERQWFDSPDEFMDHTPGTKWENRELAKRYRPLVADEFIIHKVDSVNFNPHPFVIGPKHIDAAQKHGGVLGEDVLREVPCAYRGSGSGFDRRTCDLPYDNHTHDTVMFLECKKTLTNKEAAAALFKLKTAFEADDVHIDGFGFIKSKDGFDIQPPEPKGDEECSESDTGKSSSLQA